MKRIALLFAILTLATSIAAEAQTGRRGFIAGGRGGSDSPLLKPEWSVATGLEQRLGGERGIQIGLRTVYAYSKFSADAEGYADSLNIDEAEVTGGEGRVTETGIDGVVGWQFGALGVYGFYGMHYVRERRDEAVVPVGTGERGFNARAVSDYDTSRGYGATLRFGPRGRSGLFVERYQGGGSEEIVRVEGTRFGLSWAW